jgi:hypothetical protein
MEQIGVYENSTTLPIFPPVIAIAAGAAVTQLGAQYKSCINLDADLATRFGLISFFPSHHHHIPPPPHAFDLNLGSSFFSMPLLLFICRAGGGGTTHVV